MSKLSNLPCQLSNLPFTSFDTWYNWFNNHTWNRTNWNISDLSVAKYAYTVSVVLPALNEEKTIAAVVKSIVPLVGILVDELIVMDSGSIDNTKVDAKFAGAQVNNLETTTLGITPKLGKSEVLWQSLATTSGNIIVFIDSDLINPDPMFVPKLLGPILTSNTIRFVKGFYKRLFSENGIYYTSNGGRVNELVARPLLSLLKPELGFILQPLGGEYAGTRELLSRLSFATGYGVEIGILVDTYHQLGLEAIAQVNLGLRMHRNRPLSELATMSREIIATLLSRCGIKSSPISTNRVLSKNEKISSETFLISLEDRPPIKIIL